MPSGEERQIAFALHTLSSAERNYSQMKKEVLACVSVVKQFHSYIYGHQFELRTDHKPILTLLLEAKAVSSHASARIQRWALALTMYYYKIGFNPTEAHAQQYQHFEPVALPDRPSEAPVPAELVLVEPLLDAPVKAHEIC